MTLKFKHFFLHSPFCSEKLKELEKSMPLVLGMALCVRVCRLIYVYLFD